MGGGDGLGGGVLGAGGGLSLGFTCEEVRVDRMLQ